MGKSYDKFEAMSAKDKVKIASEYQSTVQTLGGSQFLNLVVNELHQIDPSSRRIATLFCFRAAIFLRKKETIANVLKNPQQFPLAQ